jgi:lysine 2,3-aminomutase
MTDRQQRLGRSLIQHGPDSDRIYLMELAPSDMPRLVDRLDRLASDAGYSKVFAKVPASHRRAFQEQGYITEALIPRFFGGVDDGHFMAKYLCEDRSRIAAPAKVAEVLEQAAARADDDEAALPGRYELRTCTPDDVFAMAELYRRIFPSYPFPIHDPGFLRETMEEHVTYFGAWKGRNLAALASAEKYPKSQHAEMTDFATDPNHRSRGLASVLLRRAEAHALLEGYAVTYTIARALSYGMNITFSRSGYDFAGTLINNTQISGHIESMNVWYKLLRAS